MRVLLVVHGWPPAATGGTEIYVRGFARALAAQPDIDVSVLTRDADSRRPEYAVRREATSDGLTVFRINNTFQACTSFEESYANPALAAVAARLIDDIDPDLVHVQHLTCLSTRILEHAAKRAAVVMTLNDYWVMCHRGQLFRPDGQRCSGPFDGGCEDCVPGGVLAGPGIYRAGRLARTLPIPGGALAVRAMSRAVDACTPSDRTREASRIRLEHFREVTRHVDRFFAPSATMEAWCLGFGIERARLSPCNQGIDLAPFSRVSRTPSGCLRIGYAGGLIPSKAPHVLLEAVASLHRDSVSVDLLGTAAAYHGDTTYARRLAPLLGLPFVRKLGPVPHERMAEALAEIDVLVVPSAWIENAPFIIREAFAAGAPVIASNLGGMAEMVRDAVDGLLFPPGDVATLASQLARLLDEAPLIDRLRAGIRPQMSIEADAAEMRQHYEYIRRRRPHGAAAGPRADDISPVPNVTAVVLNYRTPDQTWLAVRSIRISKDSVQTIVVDNGSGDGSAERLRATLPGTTVIETGGNLGFSEGCNVGIRAALTGGAGFILLVNSDAVLAPTAIDTLLRAALEHPRAGILAPVILSREEPDRVASAGIRFSMRTARMRHIGAGQPVSALPSGSTYGVDAVSGCVMLVRREVFETAGMFDQAYFFSFEDIELCLRARRAGFDVLCVPEAVVYHEGAGSIGRRSADRVYYATRNHLRLANSAHAGPRAGWLRGGLIVGLNAGYVMLSGETPRIRGLGAVARGVWHYLGGRYGASRPVRRAVLAQDSVRLAPLAQGRRAEMPDIRVEQRKLFEHPLDLAPLAGDDNGKVQRDEKYKCGEDEQQQRRRIVNANQPRRDVQGVPPE